MHQRLPLMYGRLTSQDKLFTLRGTVWGNQIVSGLSHTYEINTNFYHKKRGFFMVKDGVVYRFIPSE